MKVLAAAVGDRDGDFAGAIVPGELVVPGEVCTWGVEGGCGCEVAWTGLASGEHTSLAEVVDLADLDIVVYLAEVRRWAGPGPMGEVAARVATDLLALAARLDVGAIVRRQLDQFIEVES